MKKSFQAWALPALVGSLLAGHTGLAMPPLVVLPLGDSITRGDSSTGEIPGGYRTRLYQRLTNAVGAVDFIGSLTINPDPADLPDPDHEGHSGNRIDQISAQYITWESSKPIPDVVLLHAGSNDMIQDYLSSAATNRLDALINLIINESSRTHIIVAKIIGATDAAVNTRILAFNPGVAGVVAAHQAAGHNVTLVNMYKAINLATDMSDGYHPNQQGYDKMADVWFDAIRSLGTFDSVRGQTLVQSNETSSSQAAFTASGSDLINAGAASLESVRHDNFVPWGAGTTSAINDGLIGGVNAVGSSAFDLDGNWRSTYVLNTITRTAGYDVKEIRTIAAFAAPRANQKFELYLSFVNAPGQFFSYGFHSLRFDEAGASLLTLADSTGVIAKGVKAIRIDFKDPRTGLASDEAVVREVDVLGAPTAAQNGAVVAIR